GQKMGWTNSAFREDTDSYLNRAVHSAHGLGRKIDLQKLREEKVAFFDFPGPAPVQFKNVFPWTSDGKVNLASSNLGPRPYAYLAEENNGYPLALISPATDKMISSTLGEFNYPELFVTMHPNDAQARSLTDGDVVKVFNNQGEVIVPLKIRASIRPGVVMMPKGAWRKSSRNDLTSTSLTPDTISEVGGGACFNDARVEIASVR
ncbi:hypothetical protein MJD09_24125, partial [bacterium]|nr:hypothetical protein [bacterium]